MMGFAEDKMWEYVKKHLDDIQALPLVDLLDHLSGCLTQPEIEALRASLRNVGPSRTAFDFVDSLRRRSDWVNAFINALRRCDRPDIADHYQKLYDGCQLPKPSQKSNIPPASVVVANPEPPRSTPLPTDIHPESYLLVERQAAPLQNPAYSRDPASPAAPANLSGATSSESQPQSQPLPSQQALSSPTPAGAPVPPVTLSHEDTETQSAKQESHPAGGVLTTNLTLSSNVDARRFQLDPDLTEPVSNPAPQDTTKGDFESRLSQEETATHAIEMPTTDGASSFTPFHLGPGKIAYVPSTDRVVRRKELAGGNGDQDEPLPGPIWKFQPAPREELARDARKSFNRDDELRGRNEGAAAHPVTRKVNETTTQQLHPNPPPAPSNIRNAPGVAPKSQIPRKHPQSRDVPDTTTSPAVKGTPVRPVQPPTRIPSTRPSPNTGVKLRMDIRDSEEEEDQACSKPGVLTSVQPTNPATHPPASPEESQKSSMRSSRLAIDQSSDNPPRNESTLNRQHNNAHPGSSSNKNLDYDQGKGSSIESSNSSSFSLSGDSIMISGSSTDSMPPGEPEEVDYAEGSPARERSTDEVRGAYRNDNSAANRVSLLGNVPVEFDDANSMENTRRYEIHYSHNPSIPNYDPMNPVNSPNNILPSGTNSQGKGDKEKKKNNVPVYQIVLAAIAFALIGVLLRYKYKQT